MKIQQTTLRALRSARSYRLSLCFPPQTPTASCPPWLSFPPFISAELIQRFLLDSAPESRAANVDFKREKTRKNKKKCPQSEIGPRDPALQRTFTRDSIKQLHSPSCQKHAVQNYETRGHNRISNANCISIYIYFVSIPGKICPKY